MARWLVTQVDRQFSAADLDELSCSLHRVVSSDGAT